jgi:signal transduction histidine kinase
VSSGYDSSSTDQGGATPRSRILSRIVRWRNWKLSIKLAAVVLVPLVFACALGTLQIGEQVQRANEYQRLEQTVRASSALHAATDQLEQERTEAVEHLAHQPLRASTPDTRAATDRLLAHSTSGPNAEAFASSEPVRAADRELQQQLAQLPGLRQQVRSGGLDAATAVRQYSQLVNALVSLDRALISQISSPELSSTATALHDLSEIRAETALQHVLVLAQIDDPSRSAPTRDLAASETRRINAQDAFRVAASPEERAAYERTVANPPARQRQASLQAALDAANRGDKFRSAVEPLSWTDQSAATVRAVDDLENHLDATLTQRAFALHDSSSNTAGAESVLLVSALILAAAVVILIGRQLLASLQALRSSALHTANTELPQAVADIRAGSNLAIAPIPVDTSEEFGEVARAFDAVQQQAVALASEQSELRKSYSDSFVNISRRSQTLLERQLRLFEQLERDEQDPDQLATLFQLDHLATRMRRNNENLMVLSGTDLARRFQQPTTPADLVRAAVSEIEHYPRVVVQPLPEAKVVGYAASDLVRLLAELLDNAANFSAPTTNVVVSGYRRGDGSVGLDIVDRGIGMSNEELAAANRRLSSSGQVDLSTSRRMGLFVVARLAARHGIDVDLQRGPNGTGLHTSVRLRGELLLESEAGAQPAQLANGVAQPVGVPSRPERVEEPVDWAAVERGAAEPPKVTRNGFHLVGQEGSTAGGDGAEQPTGEVAEESTEDEFEPTGADESPADIADEEAANEEFAGDSETSTRMFAPFRQEEHGGPAARAEETAPTPIFDNLASAWFQDAGGGAAAGHQIRWPAANDDSKGTFHAHVRGKFPSSNEDDGSEPPTTPHPTQPKPPTWRFHADEAQRRAEEVSAANPGQHTPAGLPLRVPKAHLVAGNAGGDEPGESQLKRDPEVTRSRLKAFQFGRHRYANRANGPQHAAEEAEWLSHSDEQAERAESALQNEPAEYTAAGLPQRTPRARLAPGTATNSGGSESSPGPRDAHLVRGRLASFQQGVREGKHDPRTR